MWQYSTCKRKFTKNNQSHSCVVYPIENHFKNKEYQLNLFNEIVKFIEVNIGDFNIESLPCCIHFVNNYTFAAVWIKKDKICMDFTLPKKISDKRIQDIQQPSANRYVHYVDIYNSDDLDKILLNWLNIAYFLKS